MRRVLLAGALACGLTLAPVLLAPAGADAAACATTNPAANFPGEPGFATAAEIEKAFTSARAAEGCATPLVLPAGFEAMSAPQQMLVLFNLEREARGETALKFDPTVMSQIALEHSQEMAQYGYFGHTSPINQKGKQTFTSGVVREAINPAFATSFFGEDLAGGFTTSAAATFAYMYQDAEEEWGHRGAILQGGFNWVGIGIVQNSANAQYPNYYTDDFGAIEGTYTPPAVADTNPPVVGEVSYANGTATVTGVADSPLNVNDKGATPLTAGITDVVFYTNNIMKTGEAFTPEEFNTVSATESAPGTWTAKMTVNAGEVLHAVAVDGSGNFADKAAPPPAMTITPGANTVALPAGEVPAAAAARAAAAGKSTANVLAVTPTALALVAAVDKHAGRRIVVDVRVYVDGRWVVYVPGRSKNFPLYTNEGVIIDATATTRWRPLTRSVAFTAPTIHLHRGWNFIAAPYPVTHLSCHATRLELAAKGDRLQEISVGTAPNTGFIMKPTDGHWGNDLAKLINDQKGFWVKDTGAATWVPSAVAYEQVTDEKAKPLPARRTK